jgi:tetratricopeptide (TPR) repeat protein
MRVVLLSIALTGAAWSQQSGLLERIRHAPLPPDRQASLAAAYSHRDFASIEAILAAPNGELKALLGALEFVGGRMEPAVRAFQQADALKPLTDQDRFTLAMAEIKLLDGKGSRAELTRLNRDHPDNATYLYWLARLDYDQRLYESAVERLKRVIALDPAAVRGYDNLGLAYDMMGLTAEAQAAFAHAVEMNRRLAAPSAWPPHNLGYLQLRLLQLPQAEENLREALQYDPRFALAHYHLARTLEKEEKDEAAIEEYKSAAALDATLAEPLYSLGLLYRRRGRTVEADSALAEYKKRRALAESPADAR